jgi:hypothetical protein
MRSSRELLLLAALWLGAGLAGCGTDGAAGGDHPDPVPGPVPSTCDQSYLDHGTFGEPFLLDWCAGCHSAALPPRMRQNAPLDVNFDTLADVRRFADRITARAAGATPTMPPAGGPSAEERALLTEWIACGAK